ncbi:MAG: hypothetical protein F6K28_58725 [Microcoleus sp. SIO2G3]|nr:hypothetical protein [Microcoleus sp. SIO2G3]
MNWGLGIRDWGLGIRKWEDYGRGFKPRPKESRNIFPVPSTQKQRGVPPQRMRESGWGLRGAIG